MQDPRAWEKVSRERTNGGTYRETFSRTVDVGGVRAFVSVQEVPDTKAKWFGKIECNPARVVEPAGWGLAAVEDVLPVVEEVARLMQVAGVVTPATSVEDFRVKRLDLARDFFGVESPGSTIRGLAPINRPWARRNQLHAGNKRNGAETLMVGSGAGQVRLYDKNLETKGRAPEGVLRWESENRSDWCDRYGEIGRLGDVTRDRSEALARNRWEWSAMGVEVASSVGRLVRVIGAADLTDRERAMFVGWLVCEAGGEPVELAKEALAKYRRLQRRLGIAAPTDLADSLEVVSRLDWDSGMEVVQVA